MGDRRVALPPRETCVPFHKRLTGCGAIISRLVERCLRLNHLRASRFQLICKLLPIGGDCGQRFASDILQVGPDGLGLMRAMPAVGSLLVGLALTQIASPRHIGPALFVALAVFGPSTVV